ncbi:hypothetical protein NQ317_014200 [Molorchus minor]|uniref:Uncharacterized protein n=1 Tax=Molorchus minor TaxID=1323400 RepID=A0ABQ9JDF7_9CUCU|nr:hypothetical protein NQ317_014200 [Molorchus minor]
MDDEQIIKRKLMFDGEGTGDDRRITLIQKMIVKWIGTEYQSQKENEVIYNNILSQLSLLEHSRQKSELIKSNNEKQLAIYRQYQNEITKDITSINKAINTSKFILTKVKYEKHQKVTYNMIAKDIVAQSPRKENIKCVEQLQLNINHLKEARKNLEHVFNLWRKHFVVLLTSAHQMRFMLDDEKTK